MSKADTYAKHNNHKKQTPVLSAGFEPAIPEVRRLQTYGNAAFTQQ
jgi:hypothetical protein